MLDKNDIELLEKLLDKRFVEADKKTERMFMEFDKKTEERISETENMVLEEMERTREILEGHLDQVKENLDEMKQYYQIHKLEKQSTEILMKLVDELRRRVEALEKKTA